MLVKLFADEVLISLEFSTLMRLECRLAKIHMVLPKKAVVLGRSRYQVQGMSFDNNIQRVTLFATIGVAGKPFTEVDSQITECSKPICTLF